MYKMDHDIPLHVPWNLKLKYVTQRVKRYKEMVVTRTFVYIVTEECFGSKFIVSQFFGDLIFSPFYTRLCMYRTQNIVLFFFFSSSFCFVRGNKNRLTKYYKKNETRNKRYILYKDFSEKKCKWRKKLVPFCVL